MSRPSYNGPGDRLKPYAYVEGQFVSTQSNVENITAAIVASLQAQGWLVATWSTDASHGVLSDLLGSPRPFSVYLHRTDRPYTQADVNRAVTSTLNQFSMTPYGALSVTLGELYNQVVVPTVRDVGTKTDQYLPWVLGGVGLIAFAAVIVAIKK